MSQETDYPKNLNSLINRFEHDVGFFIKEGYSTNEASLMSFIAMREELERAGIDVVTLAGYIHMGHHAFHTEPPES